MIYQITERFEKSLLALPKRIQKKTLKQLEFFKEDPHYPSLQTKRIEGTDGLWEGRVDRFYRFTFQYGKDEETGEIICTFRNIGRHEVVDHAP
jgi:mRNA interferase RelE/StbE